MAFKRLGKTELTGTGWVTLYTVPGGKYAIISSIHFVNIHATVDNLINLVHRDGALANEDYILYKEPLWFQGGANHISVQLGITMAAAELIAVKTDSAGSVAVQIWGEEGDA